ncbi:major facilitator superfamily domain-containing protein [Phascolomyces articulosus]|uniref:Major facilitator superfamily domain-containing protein n=1 Tax=Phascolomyces articulosus TaxID=60185 RepID=A0AAD5KDM2_9FUNG|nr:major facilitator superfamily domain-containing protein [Phascolomyces articulosus]
MDSILKTSNNDREEGTKINTFSLLSTTTNKTTSSNSKKSTSYGTLIRPSTKKRGEEEHTDDDATIRNSLIWKLDSRMLIWSIIANFANQLDRNNLQNAFIMGMDKDLDLKSSVYNWAILSFFIGYIMLQVPGNMATARFSPRLVLPTVVVVWGTIVSLIPIVHNYKELWVLRFFLGVCEAPFYPGIVLLFSAWYRKNELAKRLMLFDAGNNIAGAFGGLIAGFIADTMHGVGNLATWKWLFILEGLFAVIVGFAGYFLLPESPYGHTEWITSEEQDFAIQRLQKQNYDKPSDSNSDNWKIAMNIILSSPYTWLMIIIVTCTFVGHYMVFYIAIILRDMGYSAVFSNYMLAPIYIFSTVTCVFIGWSSDKTGDRAFHIIGVQLWVGTWCLILAAVNHGDNPINLVLIAIFGIVASNNLSILCMAWINDIFKSSYNAKAIAIAFVNSIAALATRAFSIKTWVVTDSPEFWLGKTTSSIACFLSVFITLLVWFFYRINFMIPNNRSVTESRRIC